MTAITQVQSALAQRILALVRQISLPDLDGFLALPLHEQGAGLALLFAATGQAEQTCSLTEIAAVLRELFPTPPPA